ncbi:MAG: helix-turn-helix domain-containing protein [Waddliaceae bacterium]
MFSISHVHSREGLIRFFLDYPKENIRSRRFYRLISCSLQKLEDRNYKITDKQIVQIIRKYSGNNRTTPKIIKRIARDVLFTASRQPGNNMPTNGTSMISGRIDPNLASRIPSIVEQFIDEHPHLTAGEIAAVLQDLYMVRLSPSQILQILHDKQAVLPHPQLLDEQPIEDALSLLEPTLDEQPIEDALSLLKPPLDE